MRRRRLSEEETIERLARYSRWSRREGVLHGEYRFRDFREAFSFMTSMAMYSEGIDHHPDWSNCYQTVKISVVTHSAGGITELDFEWVAEAERIFGARTLSAP